MKKKQTAVLTLMMKMRSTCTTCSISYAKLNMRATTMVMSLRRHTALPSHSTQRWSPTKPTLTIQICSATSTSTRPTLSVSII